MKAKASNLLSVMILACMLLMPTVSVQATAPEPLIIHADLFMTGADSAAGTFWTEGLFADCGYDPGDASEVFFIDLEEGTIHGVKTLIGDQGTITIKFQAQMSLDGSSATGRFVILAGTGDYEKLHGTGETNALLNFSTNPPTISATYAGTAHFD